MRGKNGFGIETQHTHTHTRTLSLSSHQKVTKMTALISKNLMPGRYS
jgi:hypothetical protein